MLRVPALRNGGTAKAPDRSTAADTKTAHQGTRRLRNSRSWRDGPIEPIKVAAQTSHRTHGKPAVWRNEPLLAAARREPRGLVSLGRRGARARAPREPPDSAEHRILGVSL